MFVRNLYKIHTRGCMNNKLNSTKIYDKMDDFSVLIVNFPLLDVNVSFAPSYSVGTFSTSFSLRVCSNDLDFNEQTLCITGELLSQGFCHQN